MSNFQLYSQYYDLLYQEKDSAGEVNYVISTLNRYGVPGKKWLELGAGSGRHGAFFIEQGIEWQGIERSAEMVKKAQEKELKVQIGEMQNFSLPNQDFDAVLALFHVISYLTENNDINTTFQNISEHLKPGGLFLFDIWYSPAVYFLRPEKRRKHIENEKVEIIRNAKPKMHFNKNQVDVHYEISIKNKDTSHIEKFTELHPMRHFSIPELKLIAEYHQFEWLHAEEWITTKEPGESTWGVCCILKKRS